MDTERFAKQKVCSKNARTFLTFSYVGKVTVQVTCFKNINSASGVGYKSASIEHQ